MVLTDPLHKMYGKVNKFLQKRPSWEIGKIPSYWIDKILLNEPEYDDGYVDEITWLLDLFVGGLRTAQVGISTHLEACSPQQHRTDSGTGFGHLPSSQRLRADPLPLQLADAKRIAEEEDLASCFPRHSGGRRVNTHYEGGGYQLGPGPDGGF